MSALIIDRESKDGGIGSLQGPCRKPTWVSKRKRLAAIGCKKPLYP